MTELYISIDIEADGSIPGINSMISLGAAAFKKLPLEGSNEYIQVGTFSVNILPLSGAVRDPDTMSEFWEKNPEAWQATQVDQEEPYFAMSKFNAWIKTLAEKYDAKPVAVCYPAGFDFTFVHWYFMRFLNADPFGLSCIDIKTLAMALTKKEFKKTTKNRMPKKWFAEIKEKGLVHNHIAVTDAIEQGWLFCAIMKDLHQ